ncbi:transglycosylase SLT domain-containing protein [Roseateles sp. DB2]|uniref:transglycosylase SLT domain-containing protein n=1 Tax=Roseateles sp. DB2 TaxID=3453717 RepID=UPI003EED3BE0
MMKLPALPLLSQPRSALGLCALLLLGACAQAPRTADGLAAGAMVPTAAGPAGSATELPPIVQHAPAALDYGLLEDTLNPGEKIDLADANARADLWARVRKGFAMPELSNEGVRKAEAWYAARPDYVQRMTERGSRYLYHVVEEVEKRGMPTELALLPFVESAFRTDAQSTAKAVGMWQFMPATGRDFALKQNIFRDDRRDVLASTRAALDYLGRLNKMFDGDWQLALAAYNWGPGNVQKAVKRNQAAGLPIDYDSLRIPDETRYYLPKLQAVKNIVLRPEAYGLALPEVANHPYFLTVRIERDMDVDVAARLAGMEVEAFKAFNPQMNKPVILAASTPQILLPYDNAGAFVANLAAHEGPLATWTAWVVPKTMSPADAAKHVGMHEGQLREVNTIPPRMLVKQGSTLLVPRTAHRDQDVSEHLAENASMALTPDTPPLRRLQFKAARGDTVASLASRYRVSVDQFAQWNKLSSKSSLKAGQLLVVYSTSAAPVRVAANGASTRKSGKATTASRVTKVGSSKPSGTRLALNGRNSPTMAQR